MSRSIGLRGAVAAPRERRCWLIPALGALALLLHLLPGAALRLEFDGAQPGAAWRLLGCHLVHWDARHLLWDLVMFVALGLVAESRSRTRLALCLVAAAVAIPIAVALAAPQVGSYRGLSGLDSALFTLVLAGMLRDAVASRATARLALLLLLGLAFAGKIAYEHATGTALFADSAAFVPVPLAHAIGGGIGAFVGCTLSTSTRSAR